MFQLSSRVRQWSNLIVGITVKFPGTTGGHCRPDGLGNLALVGNVRYSRSVKKFLIGGIGSLFLLLCSACPTVPDADFTLDYLIDSSDVSSIDHLEYGSPNGKGVIENAALPFAKRLTSHGKLMIGRITGQISRLNNPSGITLRIRVLISGGKPDPDASSDKTIYYPAGSDVNFDCDAYGQVFEILY